MKSDMFKQSVHSCWPRFPAKLHTIMDAYKYLWGWPAALREPRPL